MILSVADNCYPLKEFISPIILLKEKVNIKPRTTILKRFFILI